ncbi:9909_t:CDS:1, partial [Dentiscutata erythropus]
KIDSYDSGTLLIGVNGGSNVLYYYSEIHIIFTNSTNSTNNLLDTKYPIYINQFNVLERYFLFLVNEHRGEIGQLANYSWIVIDWSRNILS